MQRAPLVMLDEPFTGIDEATSHDLMAVIQEMHQQGQTVLATKEKLGCTNSQVSFGWKDIDEAEIKSQSKYCKDLAQAERFLRSKPRLPLNSIVAVSVGPLADAVMQPDVVHFYCDNLQSYHLAVDYMAGTDTHPLRPMVTMSSSACGGSRKRHSSIPLQCDPRGAFLFHRTHFPMK